MSDYKANFQFEAELEFDIEDIVDHFPTPAEDPDFDPSQDEIELALREEFIDDPIGFFTNYLLDSYVNSDKMYLDENVKFQFLSYMNARKSGQEQKGSSGTVHGVSSGEAREQH